MSNQEKLEAICKNNAIALAYLFGSQADKGRQILNGQETRADDRLADLDLAIVFRRGLPPSERVPKLYARLYNQFSEIFLPFSLDLVFLQEQHSVFQARAITGICIYSEDESFKSNYEENVMRKAADFKPFLEKKKYCCSREFFEKKNYIL